MRHKKRLLGNTIQEKKNVLIESNKRSSIGFYISKSKSCFFLSCVSLPEVSKKAKVKSPFSWSPSVSSVSSFYQPRKGKKRKTKQRREEKSSLSLSTNSCIWTFWFCRSASGGYVWHEVELVLAQPQFWKLIGPVQTQFHHQRHENLLVHRVKVDNSSCPWALVAHGDANTHPTSSEGCRGPQDLAACAQWWGGVPSLSSTGRLMSGRCSRKVLVVGVELL